MKKASTIALQDLLGIWQKVGYNEIFEFSQDLGRHYFTSDVALVLNDEIPVEKLLAEFTSVVKKPSSTLEVTFTYGIIPYDLKRLSALPSVPVFSKDNTNPEAQLNLEFFLSTLTNHFGFTKERGIDWKTVTEKARAAVHAKTSDEDLYNIMEDIIRSLDDRHAKFWALGKTFFVPNPEESAFFAAWDDACSRQTGTRDISRDDSMLEYSAQRVLRGAAKTGANNKLVWGRLEDNLGYLAFHDCSDFCEPERSATEEEQLAVFSTALDEALTDLQNTRGIIIDIRFNQGGMDAASLEVVSRFTDKPRLAFSKHAVLRGYPLTSHDVYVMPSKRMGYSKPFALLTSASTCSAAEIATFGFRVLPQGTILGQPTWGGLSDSMPFTLPNGWKARISNEIYIAADGKWYENLGIPPTLVTPTPGKGNFWEGLEAGLNEARNVLTRAST
ncbi:MAG: S41 family peptidase [Trueperaceae bacterium]